MAEKTNILPHDLLAEQAVLGSIFVDPEKIFIASEFLTQESFYKLSHGIIFNIMEELADKGEPIDPVSVKSALDSIGEFERIGGMAFLASLINSVPTSAHIEHYAKIVAEKAKAREVINDLGKALETVYEDHQDLDDVIVRLENTLTSVSANQNSGFRNIMDVLD